MAPKFAVGRLRLRAQDAIAIRAWMEQYLLNEKGRSFPDDITGSARGLRCLSCRLFVAGSDANQCQHIIGQWG